MTLGYGFIPSPSHNGFHIGPLFVHAYGLAYVFAVAGAILVTRALWRRDGGDPNLPQEIAVWAFPAGLIGGRIYFLITTPSQIPPHWWGPFAIWKGGLGIWGGIAGGVIVGLWYVRRRGLTRAQMIRLMDATAPGLLVAQAIGRIGNYFNQELFGKPTKLPWALEISPLHRPPGYLQYATFQPTFLYELLWNLLLAGVLAWIVARRARARGASEARRAAPGRQSGRGRTQGSVPVADRLASRVARIRAPGVFALYVAGYSGFRIFEENLRIDYSVHVLGMRLNFWIATLLFLAGLAWFVAIQKGWSPRIGRRPPPPPSRSSQPAKKRRAPSPVGRS